MPAGAGATDGVGSGVPNGTDGSWITWAGVAMWSCFWASPTMRDGASSMDTASTS